MKVYTYYQDIGAAATSDQAAMVKLWRENWYYHGWDPCVLNEDDAKYHRLYGQLSDNDWLRDNTCNNWSYERACYLRWLAWSRLKDSQIMVVDYDVLTYGFRPEALAAQIPSSRIINFHTNPVPGALYGRPDHFERIARLLGNASRMRAWGRQCVADNMSDQSLIVDFGHELMSCQGICLLYDEVGWSEAPLVHWCNSNTGPGRVETIRALRPPRLLEL